MIRELVIRILKLELVQVLASGSLGTTLRAHCLAPALWVWVALAVCEALILEEESGQGSKCLLDQHFFNSVELENSGVER